MGNNAARLSIRSADPSWREKPYQLDPTIERYTLAREFGCGESTARDICTYRTRASA